MTRENKKLFGVENGGKNPFGISEKITSELPEQPTHEKEFIKIKEDILKNRIFGISSDFPTLEQYLVESYSDEITQDNILEWLKNLFKNYETYKSLSDAENFEEEFKKLAKEIFNLREFRKIIVEKIEKEFNEFYSKVRNRWFRDFVAKIDSGETFEDNDVEKQNFQSENVFFEGIFRDLKPGEIINLLKRNGVKGLENLRNRAITSPEIARECLIQDIQSMIAKYKLEKKFGGSKEVLLASTASTLEQGLLSDTKKYLSQNNLDNLWKWLNGRYKELLKQDGNQEIMDHVFGIKGILQSKEEEFDGLSLQDWIHARIRNFLKQDSLLASPEYTLAKYNQAVTQFSTAISNQAQHELSQTEDRLKLTFNKLWTEIKAEESLDKWCKSTGLANEFDSEVLIDDVKKQVKRNLNSKIAAVKEKAKEDEKPWNKVKNWFGEVFRDKREDQAKWNKDAENFVRKNGVVAFGKEMSKTSVTKKFANFLRENPEIVTAYLAMGGSILYLLLTQIEAKIGVPAETLKDILQEPSKLIDLLPNKTEVDQNLIESLINYLKNSDYVEVLRTFPNLSIDAIVDLPQWASNLKNEIMIITPYSTPDSITESFFRIAFEHYTGLPTMFDVSTESNLPPVREAMDYAREHGIIEQVAKIMQNSDGRIPAEQIYNLTRDMITNFGDHYMQKMGMVK